MSGLDVRAFALGPIQTNAYIVRARADAREAVVIDPGDEPRRLLDAAEALGTRLQAILITHCHFDHIGAVAALARATGTQVWCPEGERAVLADIGTFSPPGFGPFESYEADHTLAGGERLELAGLEIDVIATPGHSPGHLTYAVRPAEAAPDGAGPRAAAPDETGPDAARPGGAAVAGGEDRGGPDVGAEDRDVAGATAERALFSGDVLFQGSVGRVDLPGGDWDVLERSIGTLIERFSGQTRVYPGHMGATTLGRELASNPFLAELRTAGAGARTAQAGS